MPEKKRNTRNISTCRGASISRGFIGYISFFFSLDLLDHHISLLAQKSQKKEPQKTKQENQYKMFWENIFLFSFIVIAEANNNFNFNFSLSLWWWHVDVLHVEPIWIFNKGSSSSSSAEEKKYRASKSEKTKAFKNEFFMPSLGLRSGRRRRHSYNIYVQRFSRLHTLALWNWISKRFRSSDVGAVIIYIHHRIRFYCGDNNLKLNVELRRDREREGTVRTK